MPTHSDSDEENGLPEWVMADLFDATVREQVLCRLHHADGPVLLCDIVAELVDRSTTGETRREVRMDLFETHLPKLTATRVVAFDSARGTLRLTDTADALATRLADCPEQ
jgi:hypothetical protein